MFKANNEKNSRLFCYMHPKLTIKRPERRRSGVFLLATSEYSPHTNN